MPGRLKAPSPHPGRHDSGGSASELLDRRRGEVQPPDVGSFEEEDGQFDRGQRTRALELVTRLPWGDLDREIWCLEQALCRGIAATEDAHELWEQAVQERLGTELLVAPEQVADLSPEWTLAYVARLFRTAAWMYGIDPEGHTGQPPTLQESFGSIAELVRGLNDIRTIRVLEKETGDPAGSLLPEKDEGGQDGP
jgi:hypothetical protein